MPIIRRKQQALPPWIDPSPAGDQTYDPHGTSRPFRPTHRTPGTLRKTLRGPRQSTRPAMPTTQSLRDLKSTIRQSVTRSWGDRVPASQQSVLKPLLLLAAALLLLIIGTSLIYAHTLPDRKTDDNKPKSATAASGQSAQLKTPAAPTPAITVAPPGNNAGPALIDQATGDEFRAPVPQSALTNTQLPPSAQDDDTAIDLFVPNGTPVYAVHAGTARIVDTARCGAGVAIAGTDGNTYIYCHASQLDIANGIEVKAGDVIMHSGTSPRDTSPNGKRTKPKDGVHFEIAVNGSAICSREIVAQWFSGTYASPSHSGMNPGEGC